VRLVSEHIRTVEQCGLMAVLPMERMCPQQFQDGEEIAQM